MTAPASGPKLQSLPRQHIEIRSLVVIGFVSSKRGRRAAGYVDFALAPAGGDPYDGDRQQQAD
jgi:hypothetical protein